MRRHRDSVQLTVNCIVARLNGILAGVLVLWTEYRFAAPLDNRAQKRVTILGCKSQRTTGRSGND
jgi:hypothetical protein